MVDRIKEETDNSMDGLLAILLGNVSVAAEALRQLSVQLPAVINPLYAARRMVFQENEHNERQWNSLMGISFGDFKLRSIVMNDGIAPVMAARVQENVALIKSIPEQYQTRLNTVVFEAVTGGKTRNNLVEEIQKIYEVSYRKARFIARDQVAKANAALSEIRQTNMGIEEYVWVTAQDERVRETHRVKHGQVFQWNDPPPDTGHPGNDYGCRCVANAIIPM